MNRNNRMDALKFFAIFMVVLGHALQHLLSVPSEEIALFRVIHSFHMPLFMAISGFFGVSLAKRPFVTVLMKRCRQLLLPSVTFGVIVVALNYLFYSYSPVKCLQIMMDVVWYLKSLLVCSLLYAITGRRWRYRTLTLLAGLVASQFVGRWQIDYMYPFFLLGIFLNKHYGWLQRRSLPVMIASGILFVVMITIWDVDMWRAAKSHQPLAFAFKIAIGVAGTLFWISLFEYVAKFVSVGKVGSHICSLGRNTLAIYLIQTVLLEVIAAHYIKFDALPQGLFSFVVAPAISLLLIVVCVWLAGWLHRWRISAFAMLGEA